MLRRNPMKKRVFSIAIFMILMVGLIAYANAFAGADTIKQRMRERRPDITALKNDGVIGENNKGFLQFMGEKHSRQDVVEGENADRKQVYQAIAKQQGSTEAAVGARRAMKIAQTAKPGGWLQNASGTWYQKQ
jgi:uncharacterized protein